MQKKISTANLLFSLIFLFTFSSFATNAISQEIKIGDKVEFERLGKTYVGEIKKKEDAGKGYSIAYKDGTRTESITLPVSRFKKVAASPANSTPAKTQDGNPVPAKMRLWTDTTGNFKVKAKFTERVDNLIRLETEDGRLITVPLEKLSLFDQKYLESAKPAMEGNPFAGGEKIDKSKSPATGTATNDTAKDDSAKDSKENSTENKSGIAMNTVTPNLDAGRKISLISTGAWNVDPDPEVPSEANPQPVNHGHGGFEKPIFDKFGTFVVSKDEKYAAVSITNSFGGNRTAIQFFDTSNGKQLSSVGIPVKDAKLVGIIINPPTFATTRGKWFKEEGRIDFWDGSDGLKHVIGWIEDYKFAKLLNDKQLLTVDAKGQAVVWDWRTAKAEYYFQIQANTTPAISANSKQIAVAISTGVMIIDVATGKPLGTLTTKDRVTKIAFSRDGMKMSTIQSGKMAIWDLGVGKLIDKFVVDGVSLYNPNMVWVDNENILVNEKTLINYRLRVPIWNYDLQIGKGKMALKGGMGGRFWYGVNGAERGTGTLIPVKIPQQEVLDVASNYDPEDFLVIKPGMKVAIRMNLPFGQPDQQKIYDSLAAKLKANGCEVDPNSAIVLNCFTEKGKTQTREYQNRGGFGRPFGGTEKVTFTPTICYMQFGKGNDIYWKMVVSSGPGMMMWLNKGETIQQAAAKQSQPSPNFYKSASIPKMFAKLPAGKKSLGKSELTENGVR